MPTLLKCRTCEKDVAATAAACPHCGAKTRSISAALKVDAFGGLLVLCLLIVIGLWIQGAINSGGSSSDSGGEPDSFATTTAPAFALSAPEIVAEYRANEVAADQKYKGQIISVTGVITKIGKDIMDSPYVTLDGGDPDSFRSAQLYFVDSSELSTLSKSEQMRAKCRCDGLVMNVVLKRCVIEAIGG